MEKVKELRQRVAQERAHGRGRGKAPFSTVLRRDVSEFLRSERGKGTSPNRLAQALGLSVPTAYHWCSKVSAGRRAFRRMAIVARPIGEVQRTETLPTASQIVVTGPSGLTTFGLGVADLAELFRRLAC